MNNDNEVVSGDAMALSADLRRAAEESWKRNEAGYRYLAMEGMSDTELRQALAQAQTEIAAKAATIDDLRDALADANADLLKAKTGTGGTDAQAERLREARIVMRALLQSIPRDSLAGTMIAAWLDAGDGEVDGE